MNMEMLKRLKEAAHYQKLAVRALMPENMEGHLDVIEKEIKDMLKETVIGIVKESGNDMKGTDGAGTEGNVKKVTID